MPYLTGSSVVRVDVLEGVHVVPDVLGGALARVELVVHLAAHVVHVVVHHRQRDADGEHGHGLEWGGLRWMFKRTVKNII